MKKFGLFLFGVPLVSAVNVCAEGESVLSVNNAIIDEFLLSYKELVGSISDCFLEESCFVDDPCFVAKEKNLFYAIQRFFDAKGKLGSIKEGFDGDYYNRVVEELLDYSNSRLPVWLRDNCRFITTDKNKVPFRYRGRYRSVFNALKSFDLI